MTESTAATPKRHGEFIPADKVAPGMRDSIGEVTAVRFSKSRKTVYHTIRSAQNGVVKEWPGQSTATQVLVWSEVEPVSKYEPDGEPGGAYIMRRADGCYDVTLFESSVDIGLPSFEAALHLLADEVADPHMASYIDTAGGLDVHYVNHATGMRVQFPVPLEYIQAEPQI